MKISYRLTCGLLFTALLSACGGGGSGNPTSGGSSSTSTGVVTNPAGDWLSFTPGQVDVTAYEGESTKFVVTGTATKPFTNQFKIGVFDNVGVIDGEVEIAKLSDLEYRVKFNSNQALKIGVYNSNFEVRLCEDDPRTCKKPLPGSPWSLPVRLTVQSDTNLTPIKALPQLSEASVIRKQTDFTSYAPASFDPKNFSRRWSWPKNTTSRLSEANIENGMVFLTSVDKLLKESKELIALNESNGQVAWKKSLGYWNDFEAPAIGSGKIFIVTANYRDQKLSVFNQSNGSLLNQITMDAFSPNVFETGTSPVVYGNEVFFMRKAKSSAPIGVMKYDIGEGKISWDINMGVDGIASRGVDANYFYIDINDTLYAISKADGRAAYSIKHSERSEFRIETMEVSDKNMIFLNSGGIHAFDLNKKTRPWKVIGFDYESAPVYSKDVVYFTSEYGKVLEARSAQSGELLWKTTLLGLDKAKRNYKTILATDNLLFVSAADPLTPSNTLAIDLISHKVVWEYPLGGSLTISDRGILYIQNSNRLAAINLQ